MKKKSITASEFEKKFDSDQNVIEYLDFGKANRPGLKPRRVSVDFPEWMINQLDRIAARLGVTRQSVIKVFISEKLKEEDRI